MVARRKTKAGWPQITGPPPATPCRPAATPPSPRILLALLPAQAVADTPPPTVRSAEAARLWVEVPWVEAPVAVTAPAAAATTRAIGAPARVYTCEVMNEYAHGRCALRHRATVGFVRSFL